MLCSLGVATKHYSTGESDKMPAPRTTFHALLFAIVNKESEATYRVLFRAAKQMALKLTGADWSRCVQQYHCDWHLGEEKARAAEFPNSMRCGD